MRINNIKSDDVMKDVSNFGGGEKYSVLCRLIAQMTYIFVLSMPKGVRLVTPKFNFCVMQEKVFGDWKIRLKYEEMPIPNDWHRYTIELVDLRSWVVIVIDSNVIDRTYFIPFDDAIQKTKVYLKHRFNYELVFE